MVVDEFSAWLEEQVQTSLEKGARVQENESEKKEASTIDLFPIETRLDEIAKAVAPVVAHHGPSVADRRASAPGLR